VPVHPTAVVDPRAEIDPSADIGPYVIVDGPVRIGPRTRVLPFAYLTGRTEIGADNVIHPGAVVGHEPQDLSYRGAPSGVRIGDRNVLREHCEVHRGTAENSTTEIADDCYLMARAHVAHNCRLGDGAIVASGAMVAGYVVVGERAFISGNCVVHQFCRIGRLAIMRGLSRTSRDVPPFSIVDGTHTVRGLNRVGLRRAGIARERIQVLATAFQLLFRARTNLSRAMARVEKETRSPEVDELLAFIRGSRRGVACGPARPAARDDTKE